MITSEQLAATILVGYLSGLAVWLLWPEPRDDTRDVDADDHDRAYGGGW